MFAPQCPMAFGHGDCTLLNSQERWVNGSEILRSWGNIFETINIDKPPFSTVFDEQIWGEKTFSSRAGGHPGGEDVTPRLHKAESSQVQKLEHPNLCNFGGRTQLTLSSSPKKITFAKRLWDFFGRLPTDWAYRGPSLAPWPLMLCTNPFSVLHVAHSCCTS